MGQYYKFINIDKKEEPKESVVFAKLTEHSYIGNNYCASVLSLLSNEWKGDRIIHIGDYAEDGDGAVTDDFIKTIKKQENLNKLYNNSFRDVKPSKLKEIRYVYNHDKKEYIDLYKQPIQWCYIKNNELGVSKFDSFALLTACGNGLGGGDYNENLVNSDKIGLWAGDHFTSSSEKLKEFYDYKENTLIFNELNKKLSRLVETVNDGPENFVITNWTPETEDIILHCNLDLIEEELNYLHKDLNQTKLNKLFPVNLLESEQSRYSLFLESFFEKKEKELDFNIEI